ncbi:hypothetical protein GGR58DRAFT_502345 [Xylaria digitata]|nr:hypothetical protein GGR58DRAFT_502345 [Xylaria digitata]
MSTVMLIFILLHAPGARAPSTPSAPDAAIKIAEDSYLLSVVTTIMGGIMLSIALLDFFFKMKDRLEAHRRRAGTSPPRNAVNDVKAAHAHAILGQSISPDDGDLEAQRQLEPIDEQAANRASTGNASPVPSERLSRPQVSSIPNQQPVYPRGLETLCLDGGNT